MANKCAICGKGSITGNKVKRRGMARAKGGAGRKITGITKRRFLPNLQKYKTIIKGKKITVLACAKCIKANKTK